MRKHRQAEISPRIVQCEVRKHRHARISPKFLTSQQLWPRTRHRCQDFGNFGEIGSLPVFSHFRLFKVSGSSSLAAFWQPRMPNASAGIDFPQDSGSLRCKSDILTCLRLLNHTSCLDTVEFLFLRRGKTLLTVRTLPVA